MSRRALAWCGRAPLPLGVAALLGLAGCSPQWRASVELRTAAGIAQPLHVALRSSLGDQWDGLLEHGCITAHVTQSPKLPNKIVVTVSDRAGAVIGRAQTNDLANRPFSIALEGGAALLVTPGGRCDAAR